MMIPVVSLVSKEKVSLHRHSSKYSAFSCYRKIREEKKKTREGAKKKKTICTKDNSYRY